MLQLPRAITIEQIEMVFIDLLKQAGVDPAVVYAYEKTLFWMTRANSLSYTVKQRQSWDKAIDEYMEKLRYGDT